VKLKSAYNNNFVNFNYFLNLLTKVCCETYKFCDKVQTDALVNNELGNPLDIALNSADSMYVNNSSSTTTTTATTNVTVAGGDETNSGENNGNHNVTLLNLIYDVTPPDFISCVVTDMGMLPCTSVPVVLRLKNRDNLLISNRKAPNTETEKNMEN
jgi:translation initiation factor eIF-2B subunit delta